MLEVIKQESHHIEELSALQFGWQIGFTQLGPAKQASMVSLVKSANVGICHFHFNANYDQRLHAQPGYYSFGLPDPETQGATVHGEAANPGTLVVFPHDREAYGASHVGFHGFGIHIRAYYLEALAETVFQKPLQRLVPAAGMYALTELQFRLLGWELRKWQHTIESVDRMSKLTLAYNEEALAIAIMSCIAHSVQPDAARHLNSDRAMRLVLDYVNDSPSEDITAVELCTLADCSQRWLEKGFKKRFGVTPKAYVKFLRLARLRQDLLHGSRDDNETVIGLASAYGFWHMGQLAADYRKVYGELPSTTLGC
jgi:AraC-like DNA-binding protein